MALLAPISHGFLEEDTGAPGLYVSEAGVVVLRSVQAGPLVPVGGGGGATSPLVLTANDATETPLTVVADSGQSVEALIVRSDDTVQNTFAVKNAAGDWGAFVVSGEGATYIYPFAADQVPLTLGAFTGQTANMLEVYDENSNPVFTVNADGSVHILTGTTVIADL